MRTSICLLISLLMLLARPAAAHPFLQDSMWIVFAKDKVHAAVNVSLHEVLVAQQLASGNDESYDAAAVDAAAEKHREYVVQPSPPHRRPVTSSRAA